MRIVLHILTTPTDALAEEVIAAQRHLPNHEVKVVDWTNSETDCVVLLQEIFRADSVEVW